MRLHHGGCNSESGWAFRGLAGLLGGEGVAGEQIRARINSRKRLASIMLVVIEAPIANFLNPLNQQIPQQTKPQPDWEGPAMGSRLDTVSRVVLRIFEEVGVHTYGGLGST